MKMKTETLIQSFLKKDLPEIRPGDTVRVYQKIKEAPKKGKSSTGREDKERIQIFEGQVLCKKHGKGITSTITVRKVISGVGVERIFPIHSPNIEKIEIIKQGKTRRAKLYYLRKTKGKKAKLKKKLTVHTQQFVEVAAEEKPTEEVIEEGEKIEEIKENE